MIENEALRQQRLAAQRKAMEAGGGEQLSMEELAARAMANLEGNSEPAPKEKPAPPSKPSTLGAYANGGDELVSEETKEALEVAGRMTVAAGKAIFSKSLEAAALAKEKAREASHHAQEKLRVAKEEREEKRAASARQVEDKAVEKAQAIEQARVEIPVAAPVQPQGRGSVEELSNNWKPAIEKKSRVSTMAVGGLLLLVLGGGLAWWVFTGKEGSDPHGDAAPVLVEPQPSPPVIAAPVIEPEVDIQPIPLPAASQEAPIISVQVPEAMVAEPDPAPAIEKKPEPVIVPKAVEGPKQKPVRAVAPKPAPVKSPVAQPESKDQWQDKGIDQLDALEKQVGG